MNIREAVTGDLPRLLELEQNIVDSERPYDAYIKTHDVSYYDIPALISDPASFLIVVESGRNVVGCGYAQVRDSKPCLTHDRHCYLGFIYLEPECRGQGMGQTIVDALLKWGKAQGMKHFQLGVYSENRAAIRAYEKAGFREITATMEMVI